MHIQLLSHSMMFSLLALCSVYLHQVLDIKLEHSYIRAVPEILNNFGDIPNTNTDA